MAHKTKVTFIEPAGAYSNVFAQYMTIPMLGPLYLATLAARAGFDAEILNENILSRPVIADDLADTDILCLSCLTPSIDRGRVIAREYKARRTAMGRPSRTIVGGIHASMIPEDVVDDFDQVFVGEGETKIVDLLSGKYTDKIVHGERMDNLDAVPIPNYTLLRHWQKIRYWPVMTSRGCPYECTFCSVTEMFGRGYRMRRVEQVIEEAKQYKNKWIFFVDDNFVVHKKRTDQLLELVRSNGIKRWSCQIRVEVSRNLSLVRRMSEAGCRTVYIGFESINPASLEEMHKNQTVEDVKNAIQVFRNHGINVHGMFILGSDADTAETIPLTSRFCRESGLTSVQYMILTPLPGTEFYRKMESEGRLLHKNWQYYDAMHVVFRPRHLSPEALQKGMIECFSDFYSYTHAIHDAVNLFFITLGNLFRSIRNKVYFPSWVSPLVKLFGKRVVHNWLRFNRAYLGYLNIISVSGQKNDNL